MQKLVEKLKSEGVLKTPSIIAAFLACDRVDFVPEERRSEAYLDIPLPIGQNQTISQPYTVAFMMELLQPQPGQRVLDVGFGSGWTTALLATVVGAQGKVYGLEIVKEIFNFGEGNLGRFYFSEKQSTIPHFNPLRSRRGRKSEVGNIELLNQSGFEGLPEEAPFDRILVSAAAASVPEALKQQLATGGRMVMPVGNKHARDYEAWQADPWYDQSLRLLKKNEHNEFVEENYSGFAFVPLVKNQEQ